MNKYLLRKKIFAGLFTGTLVLFSGVNLLYAKDNLAQAAQEKPQASSLENAANENIFEKMKFVEGYSLVQRVLGKYEFNNYKYVKDLNGFMHYSGFYEQNDPDVFEYAKRVKRLKDAAEAQGKQVIFVLPPAKFQPEYCPVAEGTPVNDPRFISEQFLFYLKRFDVNILNLSDAFPNEELPYEQCFFRTDHHWTIPAAFRSAQLVKNSLNALMNTELDPEGKYLSDSSYTAKTYPHRMLGTMGRASGMMYTEPDDFTALFPNFDGEYRRTIHRSNHDVKTTEGSYQEVVLNLEAVDEADQESLYTRSSAYSLYLNEIMDWETLENHSNPDGPKALMVRDSFFGPVMAFLAPMFSEIESVWTLSEAYNVDEIIKNNDADVIIVEVYPHNINADAFRFYQDPTPEELKGQEEQKQKEEADGAQSEI